MTDTAEHDQTQPADTPPATKGTKYTDLEEGVIIGNLTRDPEIKFTAGGQALASLRIAHTPRERNPETQDWEDGPTEYFDVTCWRNLAYNVTESLATGDRVIVTGRWQRQEWTDAEGTPRAKLVLVAREAGASLAYCQLRLYRPARNRRQ